MGTKKQKNHKFKILVTTVTYKVCTLASRIVRCPLPSKRSRFRVSSQRLLRMAKPGAASAVASRLPTPSLLLRRPQPTPTSFECRCMGRRRGLRVVDRDQQRSGSISDVCVAHCRKKHVPVARSALSLKYRRHNPIHANVASS